MDQLKPEFLKKLTKLIVVLIWVLSLLITHNFYLCRLTIQLVTHAVEKNYMFFLCNGLLVFVAKYSGLMLTSKPVEENWCKTDKTFDYRDFESYNAILELEYSVHGSKTKSVIAEEVTEIAEDCKPVSPHVDFLEEHAKDQEEEEKDQEEEEEDEEDDLLTNKGDLEEECDLSGGFKEEEEEEENEGVITEEEMNKKFDEFIRKMKEELRIEARRQLILV